jgi:RNA polymerase sigma factor (TIGR02999 family)
MPWFPSQNENGAMQPSSEFTELLRRWNGGDPSALDQLVPVVYEGLREVARQRRRGERSAASLNTTALVHEAYLKLAGLRQLQFHDRAHFMAMASRVMRQLLVDHARARKAGKRGGDLPHLELADDIGLTDENASRIADLNEALEELETIDERVGRVLEQHYFGGLTLKETAEALGVSIATVKRDLQYARAWLAMRFETESLAK